MMIVAHFYRGPADGQILTLPPEAATEVFVIAEFEPIVLEWFYYLAGKRSDRWCYLYGDEFADVIGDESSAS